MAAIIFRENQNRMSEDKLNYFLWFSKEALATTLSITIFDFEGDLDRWSGGISQMQVKLIIRMRNNWSVEEYNTWKTECLKSEEGKQKLKTEIYNAINEMFITEKVLDHLGKYINQLLTTYPASGPEDVIEDFVRGPHLSRDENSPIPEDLQNDIERFKQFKRQINQLVMSKGIVYVNSSNGLNLRSGAGVNFSKIGNGLVNKTELTLTGTTKGDWVEVKTNDGRTGWVNSTYLTYKVY
jgi:hypothetical protein